MSVTGGAIGGLGAGIVQAAMMQNSNDQQNAQMQNKRDLESQKYEAQYAMEERVQEAKDKRAGLAQQQARAATASNATAISQQWDASNPLNTTQAAADAFNKSTSAQMTPEVLAAMPPDDRAKVLAENNALQPDTRDPVERNRFMANAALNIGATDLAGVYDKNNATEAALQNADSNALKAQFQSLKDRLDRGEKVTANNQDWHSWAAGEAGVPEDKLSDTDLAKYTFGKFYSFIHQMPLSNYKAYVNNADHIPLFPEAQTVDQFTNPKPPAMSAADYAKAYPLGGK